MNDILRIGAIGCADIARRHTLPAIGRVPTTELTAIASRDGVKAAEFAAEFGGAAVTGYAALLDRSDVDAVYLAVPAALHHTWTRRALEAGKHVLVEKPFAINAADAADLLGLAARSGLALMENHKFLHHAQHAGVRAMIDDGAIGALRSFSASFGIPPRPPSDIRYRADLGGGALFDVGVYPVKAAQLFLGDDLDVAGSLLRQDERLGVDLAGNALLIGPGGVPAELSFSLHSAYRCTYAVWGSTGRIEVSRAFTPPADFRPEVRWERQGQVSSADLAPDDQAANTVRAFAAAVAGDCTATPDPAGMLRHVELLDRIRAGRTEPLPSGGDR